MEKQQYVCPKCGFVTVSCSSCGYTELYRAETDSGWNILDFLIGS